MLKLTIIFCLTLKSAIATSQNIFSALHLNDNTEYKTVRPKRIVETKTFYNSNGKQVERSVKIFDNAGMLLTEERFDESGNLKEKLTYTNDTTSRVHLTRTFERWSKLGYSKETAFYAYDSNQYLIGISDKDANGNVFQQTNLVVNKRGHPIELTLLDGNGNLFGKEMATYLYDKNKVVTSITSNEGRTLSTDTIKISFLRAYMFPSDGEAYNSNGDIINSRRRNWNGSFTEFEQEYSYDEFGNCTENKIYKVTIKNEKRKRVRDRVFKKKYTY